MSEKTRETDAKGIPLKEGPYPPSFNVFIMYPLMNIIFASLMGYIAHKFIVIPNTNTSKEKIAFLAKHDLGYLYLSLIVLRIGQLIMATISGNARKQTRVHPPDQHIYKIHGQEKMGYVFLDQSGKNGNFNRAQRAIANYQETFPQYALYIVASGLIYPKQVFGLVILFAVSRVLSAVGYTSSTNGRMGGFMISQLTAATLESLTAIIAYKALHFE
ncbi:hypothetical protein CTEN210_13295 [Chaetoceros tenuissimus]|uniref:Glutathione transferase n=1 Tax=Chaetoceros tenuissimus TaxID=426638 RepID=A0AAD3D684_9STRA|nr:hypothetical protein CTEN210_13295 [Chaetoceros tenuissimus]